MVETDSGGFLELADGRRVSARDGLTIGRLAACEVRIEDTKASRRHAALRVEGTVVEVEDLDSSNGTLLNGRPVRRRVLRDGDIIAIGTTEIVYRAGSSAADGGESVRTPERGAGVSQPPASPVASAASPVSVDREPPRSPPVDADLVVEELEFADESPDESPGESPVESGREVDANPPLGRDLFADPSAEPDVLEFADDDVVEVRPPSPPAASPVTDEPVTDEPVVARRSPGAGLPASTPRGEPSAAGDSARAVAGRADRAPSGGGRGPREHGVLRFREPSKAGSGLLGDDLGQMTGGRRLLMILVAVGIAIGLGFVAMKLAG